MVELAVLQTVSYIAGAIGVCIAAVSYATNLRISQRNMKQTLETRQSQFFMQLYQQLNSEDSHRRWIEVLNWKWNNYDEYERKYGSDDHPDMYALRQSALYELNGVGYLLRKGVIDRDTAYSLTGGITALWIWRKFEPIIKEQRILYKTPEFYIELEYLAMEMVRELEERGFPRRPLRSMHVIQVGFLHSLILSLTRYTTAYTNGNSAFTGIKNRVNC